MKIKTAKAAILARSREPLIVDEITFPDALGVGQALDHRLVLDRHDRPSIGVAKPWRAGVAVAKRELPDVILCDVSMPEMDGYGVLETLRADHATVSIPFIFLTAKGDKKDLRTGMNLGADDYLTKPASAEEVLSAMRDRTFDALVADIGMPEQDGYSLIRAIRSLPAERGGVIRGARLAWQAHGTLNAAGDNAIVVGIAVAGLPVQQRWRVMVLGIAAATILRIVFAAFTVQLLQIIGLLLAGGLLLLWVCWKLWRRNSRIVVRASGRSALRGYSPAAPSSHRSSLVLPWRSCWVTVHT